jgi:release factor glutamine methyltransferase
MSSDLSLRSLLSGSLLPPNEARILMAHVLEHHYDLPRSALLSRDDMALEGKALLHWKELESKRLEGEPIAYLVGKRGFHNIELQVAPGVLIPRPETELLVEIGLKEVIRLTESKKTIKVLDLGTGSGAIALALAHEAPNVYVTATDQSSDALAIARSNAQDLKLENRVCFSQGSWYEALKEDDIFDIILSNPPYIATQDPHLTQGDLRFEPLSALTDHGTGLACLDAIISGAKVHLGPNGLLAVEHGFDQSDAVCELMRSAQFKDIQIHQDLAGHNRAVSGRK